MATHPSSQIYAPEGPGKHMRAVLEGTEEAINEHELEQKLMWEYYKQQQEQRSADVSADQFFQNNDVQTEAYQMWEDHGLRKAYRALADEQRPAPTVPEEKTRPADGTDEDEGRDLSDETPFVPDLSLDDVLRRRAEAQAR
jgi:hypothetical protein